MGWWPVAGHRGFGVDQSRLSRSGDDIEFLSACSLKGVTVRALTGGQIEVESVGGFITSSVMSVMNQAYSRLNSAKVKDGLARRRAAGHYAVGYCPFGYRYHHGTWSRTQSNGQQPGPDGGAMAMEMVPWVCPIEPGRVGLSG